MKKMYEIPLLKTLPFLGRDVITSSGIEVQYDAAGFDDADGFDF